MNEANHLWRSSLRRAFLGQWLRDLDRLQELEARGTTRRFRRNSARSKRANKDSLAQLIKERLGISIDPQSMFDLHVKRIHEYKRQLLNVLQLVARYNRIRQCAEMRISSRER